MSVPPSSILRWQRLLKTPFLIPKSPLAMYRAKTKVDFYYDVSSPYSWIAFEILTRYRSHWNLDIHFKPVFMAGIAKANSSKFLESLTGGPKKFQYFMTDLERVAEFCQIPLRVPEHLLQTLAEVGSLRQMRFVTAALLLSQPNTTTTTTTTTTLSSTTVEQLSRALWLRMWSEGRDASADESLVYVGRKAGMVEQEINDCLKLAGEEETKEHLKKLTAEAVEEGAFGLPYMLFHKNKESTEGYFGSDRFHIIANRLGFEWKGPLPDDVTAPLEEAKEES